MIFSPIFPFLAVMTLSVKQGKEQSAVFNKTTAVEDVAEIGSNQLGPKWPEIRSQWTLSLVTSSPYYTSI